MKKINIAIDGPSGVGKSTIAKIVADKLDLVFINTGLMYRAIGFYCLENNIDLNNESEIMNKISQIKIELLPNNIVKLNNLDVSSRLLVDNISIAASKVAKLKSVREFCVKKQQEIAKLKPGVIMEGRDIGSVVLKDAELKIFLTASNEVRVKRRVKQLLEKGEKIDEKEVLKNIVDRDRRDSERKNTPLIKVEDAIEIDTSNLTLEQVIDKIITLAKEKMN
ncbi:(d)CMP kinase [Mesomycoplasma moatsii]|uniref:(d)CMP kinase n=1 Tax=Mesomycoplasma moatsii TaxID=171287 RepID=UPI0003B50D6B